MWAARLIAETEAVRQESVMGTACNGESRPDAIYYGHQIKDLKTLMRNTFLPLVSLSCFSFLFSFFLLPLFYFKLKPQSALSFYPSVFPSVTKTYTLSNMPSFSALSLLQADVVCPTNQTSGTPQLAKSGSVVTFEGLLDHKAVSQWVSSEVTLSTGPEGRSPSTARHQKNCGWGRNTLTITHSYRIQHALSLKGSAAAAATWHHTPRPARVCVCVWLCWFLNVTISASDVWCPTVTTWVMGLRTQICDVTLTTVTWKWTCISHFH